MRRTLLLLPALALVAPMVTSCGGNGDGDGTTTIEAVDLISRASAVTREAGSVQIGYHAEVEGLPEGGAFDSFEMDGSGGFDFDSERGSLTITYPDDLPGVGGLEIESVFEGTTSFMRSELFGPLPDGADWVRMDIAELLDSEAGIDVSQVPTGSSDPTAGLDMLDGVNEDGLQEVGQEDVDGVSTTHYQVDIDLSDAYEQLDAVADQEQFESFMEMFGDDDTITSDVWLDDGGRVVRQTYAQPFPIDGPNSEVTMTVTMTFSDYGDAVDVEIPDEADSVDLLDLAGAAGGN